MDERLPFDSLDTPTLRMLLEQERTKRKELTQEVAQQSRCLPRFQNMCYALDNSRQPMHTRPIARSTEAPAGDF